MKAYRYRQLATGNWQNKHEWAMCFCQLPVAGNQRLFTCQLFPEQYRYFGRFLGNRNAGFIESCNLFGSST